METNDHASRLINASVAHYKDDPSGVHRQREDAAEHQFLQALETWRAKYQGNRRLYGIGKMAQLDHEQSEPEAPTSLADLVLISFKFLNTAAGSYAVQLRAEDRGACAANDALSEYIQGLVADIYRVAWVPAIRKSSDATGAVERWKRFENLCRETLKSLRPVLEDNRPERNLTEIYEKLNALLNQKGKPATKEIQDKVPVTQGKITYVFNPETQEIEPVEIVEQSLETDTAPKHEIPPKRLRRDPSEDDWYWYHVLSAAGSINESGRLRGDEESREKLRRHLGKQPLPANVSWAVGGWRSALESKAWHRNTRKFFENKIRRCTDWMRQNPGATLLKGKRVGV